MACSVGPSRRLRLQPRPAGQLQPLGWPLDVHLLRAGADPPRLHRLVDRNCGGRDTPLFTVAPCTGGPDNGDAATGRSEEHTSELQSLMRISYAVFCLKKKKQKKNTNTSTQRTQKPYKAR